MKLIATLIALALIAVIVFDFMRQYMQSNSTGWQRVWDAGRGSATIVWQQVGLVATCLVVSFDKLVDWICQLVNAPGTDEAIKNAIGAYVNATSVGVVMIAYIGITIWARTRTL